MKGFRSWRLAFKKTVAAVSINADEAFIWMGLIEEAKSIDDLSNSGDFAELDALLSVEWDRVITGEFKKTVQLKEQELAKQNKMIKGRQTTWMVYNHFRLSDTDGAMLNWDEIMCIELKMPGYNLKQFLNDWDSTFNNLNTMPDEVFIEQILRMQLEKSNIIPEASFFRSTA